MVVQARIQCDSSRKSGREAEKTWKQPIGVRLIGQQCGYDSVQLNQRLHIKLSVFYFSQKRSKWKVALHFFSSEIIPRHGTASQQKVQRTPSPAAEGKHRWKPATPQNHSCTAAPDFQRSY